jgi:hypothetical protein
MIRVVAGVAISAGPAVGAATVGASVGSAGAAVGWRRAVAGSAAVGNGVAGAAVGSGRAVAGSAAVGNGVAGAGVGRNAFAVDMTTLVGAGWITGPPKMSCSSQPSAIPVTSVSAIRIRLVLRNGGTWSGIAFME